jgi:hypothetical protein
MEQDRIMVSFRKTEMQTLKERARSVDRSVSYVVRQICIGEAVPIKEAKL